MGTTVVSAPGKVLVAGGYLVLDPIYSALVVATSSRFYCSVRHAEKSRVDTPEAIISIRAGQFPREVSTWTYTLISTPQGLELKQRDEEKGKNKFIHITLEKALQVAYEVISGQPGVQDPKAELLARVRGDHGVLEVVVLADNDFYSQRDQLSALGLPSLYSSLDSLEPFTLLPRAISQTNKTGLGSSAALVTSLTAAILSHLKVVSIPSSQQSEDLHRLAPASFSYPTIPNDSTADTQPLHGLQLVHNLSQLSHCLAQGKVGSGFDVSSAVFGSHLYRRFSPSVLASSMSSSSTSHLISPESNLTPALDPSRWDHTTQPFRLPAGLRLMLADVDAGTDTPSFVGKVLKWREAKKIVADELWGKLSSANTTLGELLAELAEREGDEGYDGILREAAVVSIDEIITAVPISQLLVQIQASLKSIRSHLQHMSTLSDVPIEPPEQTRLLDACSALPGVLGGGVPGAGGFDAIYLLVIDRPEVIANVEKVWSDWTEMSVCPLSSRQSDGGLRLEHLSEVWGLKERLGW